MFIDWKQESVSFCLQKSGVSFCSVPIILTEVAPAWQLKRKQQFEKENKAPQHPVCLFFRFISTTREYPLVFFLDQKPLASMQYVAFHSCQVSLKHILILNWLSATWFLDGSCLCCNSFLSYCAESSMCLPCIHDDIFDCRSHLWPHYPQV